MTQIAFSDLTVRSLKPGLYFDTKTRGFGMRVGKNRRTWIVLQGQKSAKVRLGHYPALSLADARKRALVALGTPYQPSIAPSFIEAREQYLNTGKWRPRFQYQLTRWLRLYFDWTKPIDQITPHDVMLVIEAIKKPSERNHAFRASVRFSRGAYHDTSNTRRALA
jgi:Arm DNA-binding domain